MERPVHVYDMYQSDCVRAAQGFGPLEYEGGNEGIFVMAKLLHDLQQTILEAAVEESDLRDSTTLGSSVKEKMDELLSNLEAGQAPAKLAVPRL